MAHGQSVGSFIITISSFSSRLFFIARVCQGGAPAWRSAILEQVSDDQIAAVFEPIPRSS